MQPHRQMLIRLGHAQAEAHMPALHILDQFLAQPVRGKPVRLVAVDDGHSRVKALVIGRRPVFLTGVQARTLAAAAVIARLHQAHLHAPGSGLHGQTFRIPLQRVLAGCIGALKRDTQESVDGGKQHDASAALRPHIGQRKPHHARRAGKIGVQHAVVFVRSCLFARAQHQHRRAAYQRVHAGADLQRPSDKVRAAFSIRHVQPETDPVLRLFFLMHGAVRKGPRPGNDQPAPPGKRFRRGQAQSAGRARDPNRLDGCQAPFSAFILRRG